MHPEHVDQFNQPVTKETKDWSSHHDANEKDCSSSFVHPFVCAHQIPLLERCKTKTEGRKIL